MSDSERLLDKNLEWNGRGIFQDHNCVLSGETWKITINIGRDSLAFEPSTPRIESGQSNL
jgi:hypothetical protein